MTEEEWRGCQQPRRLLEVVGRTASERKLRLFGIACCRHDWDLFQDMRLRDALQVAEAILEGHGDEQTRTAAESRVLDAIDEEMERDDESSRPFYPALVLVANQPYTWETAAQQAESIVYAIMADSGDLEEVGPEIEYEQSTLLHDIFGNPFRPVAIDPAWRTSTVLALAEGIYADRAFDRLPILADALEDAGCNHPDILHHCRGDGPHVRGCWVVDLVLGKS